MGQDDDLHASLAHIVLSCVAGNGIRYWNWSGGRHNFTHPGMHANFVVHGIIGFLNFQSGLFNYDFGPIYQISLQASRYLALPCLMADLYAYDKVLRPLHLLSGVVPFVMALSGNENEQLGNVCIGLNIVSLVYHTATRGHNNEWGFYTAGAGVLAYFAAPASGVKVLYPLALAVMDYCAHRVYFGIAY